MRFLIYLIIFYFFYAVLKKILLYFKSINNQDLNTNYKRNPTKRKEKREIVEADFEEINDKK